MAEKFVVGGVVVEHLATMSNLNPSYVELLWVELSYVELGLGFDNGWSQTKSTLFCVTY